jgi:acyl transferase domain-containing protein
LLRDLAYTLGARRQYLPYRAFAITDGSAPFEVSITSSKRTDSRPPPLFVFTGQGAQWPGMGKELMADYASFLHDIRVMDSTLRKLKLPPEWSIEGRSNVYRETAWYANGSR